MKPEQAAEIIGKIMKINYQLSDEAFLKSLTGDVLSYIGVKLSAMKASLLEVKVTAHRDAMEKETLMQKQREKHSFEPKLNTMLQPHLTLSTLMKSS